MRKNVISIQWEKGLHLRPAAKLVKEAKSFKSSIQLKVNERTADARSILAIMMLSASIDTLVEIRATGNDENEAISAMSSIFNEESI